MNRRRLYRSERDRVISGVCGGLADYFEVDPTVVRVIIVVLGFVPFPSAGLWLYLVMALVVPPEPFGGTDEEPWAPGGTPLGGVAPGGYPASYTPPESAAPVGEPGATPEGAAAEGGEPGSPSTTQTWTPDSAGASGAGAGAPNGWTAPAGPADWRSQRRQERWDRQQQRWQRRQERWQERRERREARAGSGGLLFGLLLILIGGVLLWHQVDPRLNFDLAWPVVIVLFGVVLIAFSFFPGRRRDG